MFIGLSKFLFSSAAALVAAAGLVFSASPAVQAVQAAGPAQETPPPPARPAASPERLERLYQNELKALDAQAAHLERTDEIIARAQAKIDELAAKGLDISALQEALGDYQDAVADAQGYHDKAASILSAHAGFDANGKVTDAAQARVTVQEAGRALRDARQNLRPALHRLLRALRETWRDNRPRP